MFWITLFACTSSAPPTPDAASVDRPAWVDASLNLSDPHIEALNSVRLRVGLAAKDDDAKCEALVEVDAAKELLGAHFRANPGLPAADLSEAIPGLIFAAGADPEIDYPELSRAFGTSPATTAMISAAAFLRSDPVWRHHERGCFDTETTRPWLRRLGPSFARAPECLRDHYRGGLEAELAAMVDETCYCGDADSTPVAAETLAVLLSNTKDPDGMGAAEVLREQLAGGKARFDCSR